MTKHCVHTVVILSAVILPLGSCSREEAFFEAPVEIVFGAEGPAATRADVTTLSTANIVCTSGASGSETVRWSIDGADVSGGTLATGRYWPSSAAYSAMGGYHFYAANTALRVGTDGAYTGTLTNAQDIVCASLPSPVYAASNALVCDHVFSKLGDVTVTGSCSGYIIGDLTVKLTDVRTGGVYHLRSGSWTGTSGTDWTIVPYVGGFLSSSSYASAAMKGTYLIPGTYSLSASYNVYTTSWVWCDYVGKSAAVTFAPGVASNLNITLPINAMSPSVSVTVAQWSTGSAYSEPL